MLAVLVGTKDESGVTLDFSGFPTSRLGSTRLLVVQEAFLILCSDASIPTRGMVAPEGGKQQVLSRNSCSAIAFNQRRNTGTPDDFVQDVWGKQ